MIVDEAPEVRPPCRIKEPYLLVIGIPCFVDQENNRWTDALWHKDLVEHLAYIDDFTLASPVYSAAPSRGSICLSTDARFATVKFVDLPASDSLLAAALSWPLTFVRLWLAGGRARIIHAGVAGWPIPTGWAASLVAKLRRRILLINVESAFWRVAPTAPLARRLQAFVWEFLNRCCVRSATLPLFTHEEYARQLLGGTDRAYIFHASWIDSADVLDDGTAERCWDLKVMRSSLRLLFAGRLVPEKGLLDLLDAVVNNDMPILLDVIGSGPLDEAVKDVGARDSRVRLLSPVPYGEPFFELLREYHAVIVPTQTDEQPRLAYDSYSQAVPVLATKTAGNAACVVDKITGYLEPLGGSRAVRRLIERAVSDPLLLRGMGMNSLSRARTYTHQEMHRRRCMLLDQFLSEAHVPH